MKHLLLEKAFIYPLPKQNIVIPGYKYHPIKGYWTEEDTSKPLVLCEGGPKPQSKKCDQETGEDKKSE